MGTQGFGFPELGGVKAWVRRAVVLAQLRVSGVDHPGGSEIEHFLIDPHSKYMKVWDMVVTACLIFTSLVTPFEIAFMETTIGSPIYLVNRFIDVLFLKDMIMQFFIKVAKHTPRRTVWVRSRRGIAAVYLKSWFIIDLVSIFPYDHIGDIAEALAGTSSPDMAKLKVMRLLRVLRLFKLVRILKASRLVKRWQNRVSIMSSWLRLMKFTTLICVACHWMACLWGFVGVLEGSNLVCRRDMADDDERLEEFPSRQYFITVPDTADVFDYRAWNGNSWVVAFAANRARSNPVDPCSTFALYAASFYWATMTLTSIGYGDIVPVTIAEYLVCSLCMLLSSVIWAYVIGAV
eukprot:CAMPEP_0180529830 /NCGR_PEP_ID=MMETSP1036_2-20121128/61592_1 /TAXON_ID=632150 /ORGANISM="Azadinium spinosum, Strain 3D9" /LENGTH=347 /DNA_ID=CAMNT_0022543585 /DNA_START=1 /DNA_END=1042 /DNA_ORIENTATION=+